MSAASASTSAPARLTRAPSVKPSPLRAQLSMLEQVLRSFCTSHHCPGEPFRLRSFLSATVLRAPVFRNRSRQGSQEYNQERKGRQLPSRVPFDHRFFVILLCIFP